LNVKNVIQPQRRVERELRAWLGPPLNQRKTTP
jgi:hypothetical protein